VQGTVEFSALIRADGTIEDLQIISGPSLLQDEALKTVRTWRYRSFILGGQPVAIRTQIKVVFQLGS